MENKPTNQSAQIQEAKDRVAKTYPHINDWSDFMENYFGIEYVSELDFAINQVILEYSSSQLEAKDKEIKMLERNCSRAQDNQERLLSRLSQATAQSKAVNPPAQEVDVEKLAEEMTDLRYAVYEEADEHAAFKNGFEVGYNYALQPLTSITLKTNAREVDFAEWILERVVEIKEGEDWYNEGYRYIIRLSPAQTIRVKKFEELHKHFLVKKSK